MVELYDRNEISSNWRSESTEKLSYQKTDSEKRLMLIFINREGILFINKDREG